MSQVWAGQLLPLTSQFKSKLNQVEASGRKANVKPGDNGLAIGPFQIHYKYWVDAVAYDKTIGGTYQDCNGYDYSVKVVTAYLNRYGRKLIQAGDWEALARMHNGGPQGHKSKLTLEYLRKYRAA